MQGLNDWMNYWTNEWLIPFVKQVGIQELFFPILLAPNHQNKKTSNMWNYKYKTKQFIPVYGLWREVHPWPYHLNSHFSLCLKMKHPWKYTCHFKIYHMKNVKMCVTIFFCNSSFIQELGYLFSRRPWETLQLRV